MVVNIYNPTTE